jgi:ABC-2 type transport system permease protein
MDTQNNTVLHKSSAKNNALSLPVNIFLLAVRSLTTLLRTPEALLPPVAISIFFLVIYQSTLGKAADFIPGIGGSYLGFILPLSIVSGSLSGSGIAAQNLVRDIERGYFDKLLLTPVRRSALLLAPILAGAVILGIQSTIVVSAGLLLGLKPATGFLGLLVVIGLSVLLGLGFAGFTVSAALGSGSAAATQGASFLFFPLTFLAPTFVPMSLLSGWLEIAAKVNPITYVLQAMRALLNTGWDINAIATSILACLILAIIMYALAAFALKVRTRRN